MDRPCPNEAKTYDNHMCVRQTDKDNKIVQREHKLEKKIGISLNWGKINAKQNFFFQNSSK